MTDSTVRHEVEVDTRIAAAQDAYVSAKQAADAAKARFDRSVAARDGDNEYLRLVAVQSIEADEARYVAAASAANDAYVAFRTVAREYEGWSRFFLVKAANGHIHSSMDCSTCFPTTLYGWLVDASGLSEAEAVALHGERLCSVCFPSAPSAWTDADAYYARIARETRDARKAEREAKAAAKAAKKQATFEANHYSIRTTRASDGFTHVHDDRFSLARARKEVKEWIGEYFPVVVVVDLNTGEEVA